MSERLRSIVESLGIRTGDRVLEIGCGRGGGAQEHAAYVESGKAEFLVGALEDVDLGDRRFDMVFAVRVGLFHREPDRARALASRWLAPSGTVRAFYDAPASAAEPHRSD